MIDRCAVASEPSLKAVFQDYTFVGCCSQSYALLQHQTRLLLLHLPSLFTELCFQALLHRFASFPTITLAAPLSIRRLLLLALQHEGWAADDATPEEAAEAIASHLVEYRDMFRSYFGLAIDSSGLLSTLPQAIDGHLPDLSQLPRLLLSLYTEVEYQEEAPCLESISRRLALFYTSIPSPSTSTVSKVDDPPQDHEYRWKVEHVMLPACRSRWFLPPRTLLTSGALIEIANLENLYKVFERC